MRKGKLAGGGILILNNNDEMVQFPFMPVLNKQYWQTPIQLSYLLISERSHCKGKEF